MLQGYTSSKISIQVAKSDWGLFSFLLYIDRSEMQKFVGKSKICFHGFQRHLLFSTLTATSTSTDCVPNYLVDSLGFSHTQALSTSSKLAQYRKKKVNVFKFDANANSVVNFFKLHGFDDTHIRKLVSFDPRLLFSNAQKTLEPKIKMLKDEGFSGSDIITVVSQNPRLLQLGLESSILPEIQNLRLVLGCDDHVIAVSKKLSGRYFGAVGRCLPPNVALLVRYGIPFELIRTHLILRPTLFLRNPETFKDMLVRIEQKLGIPRDSPMFLHALQLAATSEENIESKCQLLKSFGWTESDVKTFMMKNPMCFSFSEASFKKKLEFLMNELELKPSYVTSCTSLFICSSEKRIMPRHKVLLFLKEKDLLKVNIGLCKAVTMSEPCFLERFVLPLEEVRELYTQYTGRSVAV